MKVPVSKQAPQRADIPEPYLLMAAATMNNLGRLVPGVQPQPHAIISNKQERKINTRVSEQTNPNVSPNA